MLSPAQQIDGDLNDQISFDFSQSIDFGSWETIPGTQKSRKYKDGYRKTIKAECYCGKVQRIAMSVLGHLSRCCYHKLPCDVVQPGQVFGMWETISYKKEINGLVFWKCRCMSCYKLHTVNINDMIAGRSRMCVTCQVVTLTK
jgi:hypothetical protein